MLFLPIQSILVSPTRQRREFEPQKLQELADSIDRVGLQNAVVVREVNGGYQLVSGERRLRAIRDHLWPLGGKVRYAGRVLDDGLVPAVPLGELGELEAEEAELDENIRRTDLTLQERIAAVGKLADLRRRQAATQNVDLPSVADIALEVRGSAEGVNHEDTRREIILAKHLDKPAVAQAKTLDEAWKALKRDEELRRNAELAQVVGRTFSADLHSVKNTDALEWLGICPSETFDVILTDPPYGVGADEFGDSGKLLGGEHAYVDDSAGFLRIARAGAQHFCRIAKPQAHLYWFCDIEAFIALRTDLASAGWWVHRTPLIWHKPNAIRVPWPEHGPRRTYELILYAVKGKRPTLKQAPDLVSFPPDANLGHGAQKPVALYEELLRRSARPGDTVCDPFCGTGPVFPAAHALQCRAVGIEIDPAAYGIAVQRIASLRKEESNV